MLLSSCGVKFWGSLRSKKSGMEFYQQNLKVMKVHLRSIGRKQFVIKEITILRTGDKLDYKTGGTFEIW